MLEFSGDFDQLLVQIFSYINVHLILFLIVLVIYETWKTLSTGGVNDERNENSDDDKPDERKATRNNSEDSKNNELSVLMRNRIRTDCTFFEEPETSQNSKMKTCIENYIPTVVKKRRIIKLSFSELSGIRSCSACFKDHDILNRDREISASDHSSIKLIKRRDQSIKLEKENEKAELNFVKNSKKLRGIKTGYLINSQLNANRNNFNLDEELHASKKKTSFESKKFNNIKLPHEKRDSPDVNECLGSEAETDAKLNHNEENDLRDVTVDSEAMNITGDLIDESIKVEFDFTPLSSGCGDKEIMKDLNINSEKKNGANTKVSSKNFFSNANGFLSSEPSLTRSFVNKLFDALRVLAGENDGEIVIENLNLYCQKDTNHDAVSHPSKAADFYKNDKESISKNVSDSKVEPYDQKSFKKAQNTKNHKSNADALIIDAEKTSTKCLENEITPVIFTKTFQPENDIYNRNIKCNYESRSDIYLTCKNTCSDISNELKNLESNFFSINSETSSSGLANDLDSKVSRDFSRSSSEIDATFYGPRFKKSSTTFERSFLNKNDTSNSDLLFRPTRVVYETSPNYFSRLDSLNGNPFSASLASLSPIFRLGIRNGGCNFKKKRGYNRKKNLINVKNPNRDFSFGSKLLFPKNNLRVKSHHLSSARKMSLKNVSNSKKINFNKLKNSFKLYKHSLITNKTKSTLRSPSVLKTYTSPIRGKSFHSCFAVRHRSSLFCGSKPRSHVKKLNKTNGKTRTKVNEEVVIASDNLIFKELVDLYVDKIKKICHTTDYTKELCSSILNVISEGCTNVQHDLPRNFHEKTGNSFHVDNLNTKPQQQIENFLSENICKYKSFKTHISKSENSIYKKEFGRDKLIYPTVPLKGSEIIKHSTMPTTFGDSCKKATKRFSLNNDAPFASGNIRDKSIFEGRINFNDNRLAKGGKSDEMVDDFIPIVKSASRPWMFVEESGDDSIDNTGKMLMNECDKKHNLEILGKYKKNELFNRHGEFSSSSFSSFNCRMYSTSCSDVNSIPSKSNFNECDWIPAKKRTFKNSKFFKGDNLNDFRLLQTKNKKIRINKFKPFFKWKKKFVPKNNQYMKSNRGVRLDRYEHHRMKNNYSNVCNSNSLLNGKNASKVSKYGQYFVNQNISPNNNKMTPANLNIGQNGKKKMKSTSKIDEKHSQNFLSDIDNESYRNSNSRLLASTNGLKSVMKTIYKKTDVLDNNMLDSKSLLSFQSITSEWTAENSSVVISTRSSTDRSGEIGKRRAIKTRDKKRVPGFDSDVQDIKSFSTDRRDAVSDVLSFETYSKESSYESLVSYESNKLIDLSFTNQTSVTSDVTYKDNESSKFSSVTSTSKVDGNCILPKKTADVGMITVKREKMKIELPMNSLNALNSTKKVKRKQSIKLIGINKPFSIVDSKRISSCILATSPKKNFKSFSANKIGMTKPDEILNDDSTLGSFTSVISMKKGLSKKELIPNNDIKASQSASLHSEAVRDIESGDVYKVNNLKAVVKNMLSTNASDIKSSKRSLNKIISKPDPSMASKSNNDSVRSINNDKSESSVASYFYKDSIKNGGKSDRMTKTEMSGLTNINTSIGDVSTLKKSFSGYSVKLRMQHSKREFNSPSKKIEKLPFSYSEDINFSCLGSDFKLQNIGKGECQVGIKTLKRELLKVFNENPKSFKMECRIPDSPSLNENVSRKASDETPEIPPVNEVKLHLRPNDLKINEKVETKETAVNKLQGKDFLLEKTYDELETQKNDMGIVSLIDNNELVKSGNEIENMSGNRNETTEINFDNDIEKKTLSLNDRNDARVPDGFSNSNLFRTNDLLTFDASITVNKNIDETEAKGLSESDREANLCDCTEDELIDEEVFFALSPLTVDNEKYLTEDGMHIILSESNLSEPRECIESGKSLENRPNEELKEYNAADAKKILIEKPSLEMDENIGDEQPQNIISNYSNLVCEINGSLSKKLSSIKNDWANSKEELTNESQLNQTTVCAILCGTSDSLAINDFAQSNIDTHSNSSVLSNFGSVSRSMNNKEISRGSMAKNEGCCKNNLKTQMNHFLVLKSQSQLTFSNNIMLDDGNKIENGKKLLIGLVEADLAANAGYCNTSNENEIKLDPSLKLRASLECVKKDENENPNKFSDITESMNSLKKYVIDAIKKSLTSTPNVADRNDYLNVLEKIITEKNEGLPNKLAEINGLKDCINLKTVSSMSNASCNDRFLQKNVLNANHFNKSLTTLVNCFKSKLSAGESEVECFNTTKLNNYSKKSLKSQVSKKLKNNFDTGNRTNRKTMKKRKENTELTNDHSSYQSGTKKLEKTHSPIFKLDWIGKIFKSNNYKKTTKSVQICSGRSKSTKLFNHSSSKGLQRTSSFCVTETPVQNQKIPLTEKEWTYLKKIEASLSHALNSDQIRDYCENPASYSVKNNSKTKSQYFLNDLSALIVKETNLENKYSSKIELFSFNSPKTTKNDQTKITPDELPNFGVERFTSKTNCQTQNKCVKKQKSAILKNDTPYEKLTVATREASQRFESIKRKDVQTPNPVKVTTKRQLVHEIEKKIETYKKILDNVKNNKISENSVDNVAGELLRLYSQKYKILPLPGIVMKPRKKAASISNKKNADNYKNTNRTTNYQDIYKNVAKSETLSKNKILPNKKCIDKLNDKSTRLHKKSDLQKSRVLRQSSSGSEKQHRRVDLNSFKFKKYIPKRYTKLGRKMGPLMITKVPFHGSQSQDTKVNNFNADAMKFPKNVNLPLNYVQAKQKIYTAFKDVQPAMVSSKPTKTLSNTILTKIRQKRLVNMKSKIGKKNCLPYLQSKVATKNFDENNFSNQPIDVIKDSVEFMELNLANVYKNTIVKSDLNGSKKNKKILVTTTANDMEQFPKLQNKTPSLKSSSILLHTESPLRHNYEKNRSVTNLDDGDKQFEIKSSCQALSEMIKTKKKKKKNSDREKNDLSNECLKPCIGDEINHDFNEFAKFIPTETAKHEKNKKHKSTKRVTNFNYAETVKNSAKLKKHKAKQDVSKVDKKPPSNVDCRPDVMTFPIQLTLKPLSAETFSINKNEVNAADNEIKIPIDVPVMEGQSNCWSPISGAENLSYDSRHYEDLHAKPLIPRVKSDVRSKASNETTKRTIGLKNKMSDNQSEIKSEKVSTHSKAEKMNKNLQSRDESYRFRRGRRSYARQFTNDEFINDYLSNKCLKTRNEKKLFSEKIREHFSHSKGDRLLSFLETHHPISVQSKDNPI